MLFIKSNFNLFSNSFLKNQQRQQLKYHLQTIRFLSSSAYYYGNHINSSKFSASTFVLTSNFYDFNRNHLLSFKLNKNLISLNKKYLTTKTAHSEKNNASSAPTSNNYLNISKTKRLMRLIYSKVHPDLFTNHLQAQKQNEYSLKILRNLIDLYSTSVANSTQFSKTISTISLKKSLALNKSSQPSANKTSSHSQDDLVFYVKDSSNSEDILKKVLIKNIFTSSSMQSICENVFNQFIDNLDISMDRFSPSSSSAAASSTRQHASNLDFDTSNRNIKVTFRNLNNFDYDDDYIDFEEFERWSNLNMKQNKTPSLEKWLEMNKTIIENNLREAKKMQLQIEANKRLLIKKWKLKNVIFKSNWSLKNFNSYLLALNSVHEVNDTHFEGFTLVLTNSNIQGLRKNGQIHLNCSRVYQEWLQTLAISKKTERLLKEIKEMEAHISSLLQQIKICDSLDELLDEDVSNSGEDESIHLASYYHQMLNCVLNNLTSNLSELNSKEMFKLNTFSHLQLTIQNVNEMHYLNEVGQFVLGISSKINHENTIKFINSNKDKSVQLYKNYIKQLEKILKLKERIEMRSNPKMSIKFDTGLSLVQKIESLNKLDELLTTSSSDNVLPILNGIDLKIGTYYCLNDNGSIQIPWNWFVNAN